MNQILTRNHQFMILYSHIDPQKVSQAHWALQGITLRHSLGFQFWIDDSKAIQSQINCFVNNMLSIRLIHTYEWWNCRDSDSWSHFIPLFVLFVPDQLISVVTTSSRSPLGKLIPMYFIESPMTLVFDLNEFSRMELRMHALKQQPNRREARSASSKSIPHNSHMWT
jgi:hypothetical protein